jgi:uncharacterized membrane protein YfcA
MEIYEIIIVLIGGLLAGAINTMAGNGSAITLSIFSEVLGLPPNIANGTNRVGVAFQTAFASSNFYKNKIFTFKESKHLIISTFIGAMLGVYVAVNISNEAFKSVFSYMLIVIFLLILLRPKRWLEKPEQIKEYSLFITVPVFLALGFYGGFLQMGMGIFMLAALVFVGQLDIIKANALKSVIILFYAFVVMAIFHYKGLIHWKYGLMMAVGQSIGGYFTAEFASKYKSANVWAYRLLIVAVFIAILKLFNVHQWILQLFN